MGQPFLGLDDTFATPWRLKRERITDAFEGPERAR